MAKITVQDVAAAGVVGAGGAGFPTHVKLSGKADTVLVNAAECEPLLHKDKEMLREYPEAVLEGLVAGMEMVGARRGKLSSMNARGDFAHAAFSIPARGLIGLRTRLLAEVERATRDFAVPRLAAGDEPTRRALVAAVAELERHGGLLRLNLNESAVLEGFLLASLRIWSRR